MTSEARMEYQPMPQMNMGMGMGMGMGIGMGMGHSNFQPMYQGQIQQQGGATRQMDRAEQEKMEAAFEQALEDARAQTRTETTANTKSAEPEVQAEETRETKGDLDAVWESLKPEAERLNKLAEWEKDFSQVSQYSIVQS
jgi:peroxin-5